MPYTPWLTEGNRPNRSVIARSRRNVSPVRIPLCIHPSVFRSGLFRFYTVAYIGIAVAAWFVLAFIAHV